MNIHKYLRSGILLFFFFSLLSYNRPDVLPAEHFASPGVIWHDLVTPDIYKSKAFYEAVFGWELRVVEGKGLRIGTFYADNAPVAGVLEVPTANTAVWVKAMIVNDLKERVDRAKRQGGKVLLPPAEVIGRGTQVVMESVSGEEFSFIQTELNLEEVTESGENRWLWSELWSDDPESSGIFYQGVFGVTLEDRTSDQRPYWVFMAGDRPLAGMIQNPVTNQGTQWVPYVQTNDPSGVTGKAEAAGAFVVLGPTPEVREGRVGVFQDPQGALICVQHKD